MSYNKILLVNPPYSRARVKAVFSAGLGYIAEILKASGFEHHVLDMSLGYDYNVLQKKIDEISADLIAISMMSYNYKETYALVEKIKIKNPNIGIVAGGPHISLLRKEVLNKCKHLDYGVVLEGERTIVELCQGNALESIKGLIYRSQNNMVYNGDRDFIENLDGIPYPCYEGFELEKTLDKNVNALPIVSSRGCPFDCIYCPVQCSIGARFRMRSPENILGELRYWYDKGYKRFSFADDNFTLVKERVFNLCELIKKSNMPDLKLSCDNGIRADRVDRDLLTLMKQVGFYRIAFGVEAGNDKILKNLKKSENIGTLKQRITEACDLGYEVDLFFLVGSPGETPQDLNDSFKIALEYPIGIAYFYNIIPFPHTELFSWIEKNGRFLKDPADYLNDYPILDNVPVFETKDMPFKLRKKALGDAFSLMRKTMRRSWSKRLSRLGVFGKFIAFIYTTAFIQDVVLRNKALRSLVYKLAKVCFS